MLKLRTVPADVPAVAMAADRDCEGAEEALTELGGEVAAELLRVTPIVIAVANSRKRIRLRKPILIGVRNRADFVEGLNQACGLIEGPCAWMIFCDAETTRLASQILQLDEDPQGTA